MTRALVPNSILRVPLFPSSAPADTLRITFSERVRTCSPSNATSDGDVCDYSAMKAACKQASNCSRHNSLLRSCRTGGRMHAHQTVGPPSTPLRTPRATTAASAAAAILGAAGARRTAHTAHGIPCPDLGPPISRAHAHTRTAFSHYRTLRSALARPQKQDKTLPTGVQVRPCEPPSIRRPPGHPRSAGRLGRQPGRSPTPTCTVSWPAMRIEPASGLCCPVYCPPIG